MKRAARHFGEKLGNSLYHDGFNANNAPPTLKDSLDNLDIERAKSRFGFDKDRKMSSQNVDMAQIKASNQMNSRNSASSVMAKQETKKVTSDSAPNTNQYAYSKQASRIQYVGNAVLENSSVSNQSKADHEKPSHVTPYHGTGNNIAQTVDAASD